MISPDHLLDHAMAELPQGRGAPRQADLRRTVSTAYYATFHELCTQVADAFVGAHDSEAWAIFYRAPDHRAALNRCRELLRTPVLEARLAGFATVFQDLQAKRHSCDYDPLFRISRAEAAQAIEAARDAIGDLRSVEPAAKLRFLATILLGKRA